MHRGAFGAAGVDNPCVLEPRGCAHASIARRPNIFFHSVDDSELDMPRVWAPQAHTKLEHIRIKWPPRSFLRGAAHASIHIVTAAAAGRHCCAWHTSVMAHLDRGTHRPSVTKHTGHIGQGTSAPRSPSTRGTSAKAHRPPTHPLKGNSVTKHTGHLGQGTSATDTPPEGELGHQAHGTPRPRHIGTKVTKHGTPRPHIGHRHTSGLGHQTHGTRRPRHTSATPRSRHTSVTTHLGHDTPRPRLGHDTPRPHIGHRHTSATPRSPNTRDTSATTSAIGHQAHRAHRPLTHLLKGTGHQAHRTPRPRYIGHRHIS